MQLSAVHARVIRIYDPASAATSTSAMPLTAACNAVVRIVEPLRHLSQPNTMPSAKISPTKNHEYCTCVNAHTAEVRTIVGQAPNAGTNPRKKKPRNSNSSCSGPKNTNETTSKGSMPAILAEL